MNQKNTEPGAWRWPAIVIALLATHLTVGGVMLYFATMDPSFAVEEDYYAKALAWDSTARQRGENAELGWSASVRVADSAGPLLERAVTLTLVDAAGAPVERAGVRLVAFHNARSDDRLESAMSESRPGVYTADLRIRRPGVWEFRVTAERGADRFTDSLRSDVPPALAEASP